MKALILTALFISTSSFAFDAGRKMPNTNDWAKAMTAMACKTDFPTSYTGEILENDNGVVYEVSDESGEVVAAATARSTFILAKKTCL